MLEIVQKAQKDAHEWGQKIKKNIHISVKFSPILSFVVAFLLLYFLYPGSFEKTWKGRTYYLFFLWLVFLEIILNWERLQTNKVNQLVSRRTIAFTILLVLPTIYVFASNFLGLNTAVLDYSKRCGMGSWYAKHMPLSIEYLVFAMDFVAINLIVYGRRGLTDFSVSTSLLFIIGTIYMIDNLYPRGQFAPFQFPVLTTATLAAKVLNLMGYKTTITVITDTKNGRMPHLTAWDPKDPTAKAGFGIAWPCAGIESLLIYAVTVLLFLKRTTIRLRYKTAYFVIGAIVTYSINILRVSTIFMIAINGGEWTTFHNYYGQLYSIVWIVFYPLIIMGSRVLWGKSKT